MTNPLCSECGIYSITLKKICNYTGYNEDSVKALIKVFEVDNQRIVYDLETEEMCILKKPNYIDRLGKPVLDCLKSEFGRIKNKMLIFRQLQHLEKQDLRIVYEDYTKRWQEEEKEKEEKKKKMAAASVTLDDAQQAKLPILRQLLNVWLGMNKNYKSSDNDLSGLRKIAVFITDRNGLEHLNAKEQADLIEKWTSWCFFILQSPKYKHYELQKIGNFYLNEINQELLNPSHGTTDKSVIGKTFTPDKF
jgi:hypothetical protein